MKQQRKLFFAVNAHAGKEAIKTPFLKIVDIFIRAGYEPTVYLTQRSGELAGVIAEKAGAYDLVVCSGGDGTLNETINGLMRLEHPPTLGYIPAGTTNDFASSLSIPKNILKAAEAAVGGVPVHVDVGPLQDRHFAYVAAFGAFTDVPYVTSQDSKNSLGKLAYLVEGAQRLSSLQTYHLEVEHDGGTVEGEFLLGMVSNSSYVAGLPVGRLMDVSLTDGLMEVGLVRKPAMMIELTRVASNLLLGELDPERIVFLKTQKLRVRSLEPIPWTLDGEFGGIYTDALLENLPRRLCVNVPPAILVPRKKK